ncbi:hypothetical protein ScPMuIL_011599 [Solemya velum]
MRARLKNVVVLLLIVCSLPLIWVSLFTQDRTSIVEFERRFAELQEQLHYAQQKNIQQENDLQILRNQVSQTIQLAYTSANSSDKSLTQILPSLRYNQLLSEGTLHLPSLYTYLPHIIGNPGNLRPALRVSKNRLSASIVFGIPTIKRDKASYLHQTLNSLIDGLSIQEKEESLIVVFIAEVSIMFFQHEFLFRQSISSGLLEVIAPPAGFYPDLDKLKISFGDTKDRVRWRTKQNLDYSFLMLYAQSRGVYYVQLEDDVVVKPGYFSIMKTYAEEQKTDEWLLLEFSSLGFIGKLFKSSQLPTVVEFFLMFYEDKPIDWLLDYYLIVKVCSPEKDAKHCTRMKSELRRRFKPSLFQHIGMHSSLKGKVQKLKDRDFGKKLIVRAHVNPRAECVSTLKPYKKFYIEKAYLGEDIFWSLAPEKDDFIRFNFFSPIEIESFLFRSGNVDHPDDKLYNATVELQPDTSDLVSNFSSYKKSDDGYFVVGSFDKSGLASGNIGSTMGRITSMQIHIHNKSDNWVIISEIFIKKRS